MEILILQFECFTVVSIFYLTAQFHSTWPSTFDWTPNCSSHMTLRYDLAQVIWYRTSRLWEEAKIMKQALWWACSPRLFFSYRELTNSSLNLSLNLCLCTNRLRLSYWSSSAQFKKWFQNSSSRPISAYGPYDMVTFIIFKQRSHSFIKFIKQIMTWQPAELNGSPMEN